MVAQYHSWCWSWFSFCEDYTLSLCNGIIRQHLKAWKPWHVHGIFWNLPELMMVLSFESCKICHFGVCPRANLNEKKTRRYCCRSNYKILKRWTPFVIYMPCPVKYSSSFRLVCLSGLICYSCHFCFIFPLFYRELDWHFLLQAASGSVPSADKSSANKEEEKSETYSHNMTEAMGVGMFTIFVLLVQQWCSLILLDRLG